MKKNIFKVREALGKVAKEFVTGNGFAVKQILRTEFGLTANSEGSRQESWKRIWRVLNYCKFKGYSEKTFVNIMLDEGLHLEGCAPFEGNPAKEYLYFGKEPIAFTKNIKPIIEVLEGIGCWEFDTLEWYAFNLLNKRRKAGEEAISFSEEFLKELRSFYREIGDQTKTPDYGRKQRADFRTVGEYLAYCEEPEVSTEPTSEFEDTRWDYNPLGGWRQGRDLAELLVSEEDGFIVKALRDYVHLDKPDEATFWFERARVSVERLLLQCGDLYEVDRWNESEELATLATTDVWKIFFTFKKADELGKRKELKISFNKVIEGYLDSLVEETEEELDF